jgi:hypothetical protein
VCVSDDLGHLDRNVDALVARQRAHPPVEPAAAHPRQRDRIAMIGDQAHDPRSIESMQRLGDHPHTANRERDPPPRRAILERVIDSAPARNLRSH